MIRNTEIIKSTLYAIATAALLWMPLAHGKTCTPNDAMAADAMVDHLDSWIKVKETFIKYGHCDDGEIAEGNSEAIARLLVDHWKFLPQLEAMIKHNPPLKTFVLRHIDTTLDTDDLDTIKTLASSSCPSGMNALCQELIGAVSQAKQSLVHEHQIPSLDDHGRNSLKP